MTILRAGSATDIGNVRSTNQDQLLVESPLFAVADGMGGHAAGEVAALTAVEALRAAFKRDPTSDGLLAAAETANRSIWDQAQADAELRGMGTTLVAVALVKEEDEDRLAIVNVGDSRVYLLRDGELEQLTTDHSLVQELVDDGQLSEVEATVHPQRHVLTRALGVDSDVGVDLIQLLPMRADRLLLCSDGLSRELSDSQVASVLRRFADPGQAARELVAEAKAKGGNDNITVVIIDVVDDDSLALTASEALAASPGPIITSTPQYETTRGKGLAGDDAGGRRGRGRGREEPASPAPKQRLITLRVVGFVALLLLLVGGAVVAVGWYARGSYFVGLDHSELTIYRGRPGGLLWFQPTVMQHTGVKTNEVLPFRLNDLQNGKEETSVNQARQYVTSLKTEAQTQAAQRAPTAPATTTTAVPTTVVPTTVK